MNGHGRVVTNEGMSKGRKHTVGPACRCAAPRVRPRPRPAAPPSPGPPARARRWWARPRPPPRVPSPSPRHPAPPPPTRGPPRAGRAPPPPPPPRSRSREWRARRFDAARKVKRTPPPPSAGRRLPKTIASRAPPGCALPRNPPRLNKAIGEQGGGPAWSESEVRMRSIAAPPPPVWSSSISGFGGAVDDGRRIGRAIYRHRADFQPPPPTARSPLPGLQPYVEGLRAMTH
jgi:hypothetical protein